MVRGTLNVGLGGTDRAEEGSVDGRSLEEGPLKTQIVFVSNIWQSVKKNDKSWQRMLVSLERQVVNERENSDKKTRIHEALFAIRLREDPQTSTFPPVLTGHVSLKPRHAKLNPARVTMEISNIRNIYNHNSTMEIVNQRKKI